MSQPIWLGVGNPKPQSRELKSGMFGHVADAFDDKSITKIGEISPYERRMMAAKEAERVKAEMDREKKGNGSFNGANGESKDQNGGFKTENGGANGSSSYGLVVDPANGKGSNTAAQTLIKGGKVVNDDCCILADVLLQDDKIVEVSSKIDVKANMKVIDATNKYLLPGGIDLTTSFGIAPFKGIVHSCDDFIMGTKAALLGGSTLIVHNLEPELEQSYVEAYDQLMAKIGTKKGGESGDGGVNVVNGGINDVEGSGLYCDFVVKVGLTWWSDEAAKQLEVLVKEKGTTLCYIPWDISYSDAILAPLCKCLKALGAVLVVTPAHPLTTQLLSKELSAQGITGPEGCYYSFPEEAELSSVHRYISIASQLHLPLYVSTISSHATAQLVAKKRREGHVIFSEVALASISLDGSKVLDADWATAAHHVTHPPIRMKHNNAANLLNQLACNDIQLLASNHTSLTTAQKAYGKDCFSFIPPGVPGVQERMEVLWSLAVCTGVMDACRMVACTSSTPAKLLNIYPCKGRIAVGSDADLCIMDPRKSQQYKLSNRVTKADLTVYEEMVVAASVVAVVKSGRVVVSEGVVEPATVGKLIKCTGTPDVAFSRISFLDDQQQKGRMMKGVRRDAYEGPISGDTNNNTNANNMPSYPAGQRSENFCRPPTRSGGKNMQDTTLFISVEGTYAEDKLKCQKLGGYRVNQPPGGRTTQFW